MWPQSIHRFCEIQTRGKWRHKRTKKPQNDYAVAREYLSESIRSSWNPNQEVLIQRSSPQVVISDQDTAELVIDVAATVDADGKYQVTPLGTGRVLEFSFVLENAEWRLSRVPDATVLIRPVFDVVFSGYSVFFLDRQKRFLVPELRWFPTTPATGTRHGQYPGDWAGPPRRIRTDACLGRGLPRAVLH